MTTFRSIEDRVRAIAELAYYLWRERGCPDGSPEEDRDSSFPDTGVVSYGHRTR